MRFICRFSGLEKRARFARPEIRNARAVGHIVKCIPACVIALAAGTLPIFAQSDTTAPLLTALSFTSSVNVTAAAQNVIVDATITDDVAGVSSGSIRFTGPNGQTASGLFARQTGTSVNGTYRATVIIPRFAQPGVWKATVFLSDAAGNGRSLVASSLQALGFPTDLAVVDSTPDSLPPTLLGVSLSPATIDVSSADATVTINLQVADNVSGAIFNNPFTLAVTFVSPGTGSVHQSVSAFDFHLVSGTNLSGIWQAMKKIPRYSPAGAWQIQSVILTDLALNQITLSTAQLLAAGINPTLSVVSSPIDSTPPVLTGLSFSPPLFNTSTAAQTVTVTLSASDDLSGLDFTPLTPTSFVGAVQFISPSGAQFAFVNSFVAPANVSGTPLSGTWLMSLGWPQFSEEGTWQLSSVALKDAVGNQKNYTPAMLQALGFPTTIIVTKPSLNVDGTVGQPGGTITDNSFGSRALITFPAGVASGSTNVSIDVFANPLQVPTPQGFTVPGTYFVNVGFSPPLSSPLLAPGITVVLPLVTPMTPGAHLSLYHIDPVSGILAPAMDAFHHFVVGTVNSDGVSATFLNVVTLSTVVAYLSSGSVLGDIDGNGSVSCADVSLLKVSFGIRQGQAGFNSAADLNGDRVVDIRDLFVINRQLPAGTTCP